jgi:CheY-like chemotaxis protein
MESRYLKGLNVLFADDRRDARFVVEHILRDAGATVMSVENGFQALAAVSSPESFASDPFDVVIMDVSMPIIDGLTATRQLRKTGHQVPIVALTAGAMEEDRQECLSAGYSDYLSKPIDGARLVQTVHRLARPTPCPA